MQIFNKKRGLMFKFKFRKRKATAEESAYVEKQVRKIPKIVSIVFLIYVIIFVCFMIWYFDFRTNYYISDVEGPSMSPTINAEVSDSDPKTKQDFVYVNKKKEAQRGDIIVINVNTTGVKENDHYIIKRVIAMAGDKVTIKIADDGYYHVFVQYAGQEEISQLDEDYIKSYESWMSAKPVHIDTNTFYEAEFYSTFISTGANVSVIDGVAYYEIPEDSYFCLGDNRAVSKDSRNSEYRTFSKSKISGVAEIIVKNGAKVKGIKLFFKKWGAIWGYYWKQIEMLFAR